MNFLDPIRTVFRFTRVFLTTVLSIKGGTDYTSSIEGIKKDIIFRGPSAWILIFSIFIASIGLNINSTAVIIGAMLISPLMGPILGVGLSLGINDFETLLRSLKNLGVAVLIALITSTIYFALTPLDIEQSELLNRTKPTILDVLIAFFGGMAGIIAGSRKEKSNVVPGVAIATALMPPLCTAGYGLANLNLTYFLGAFYLFFINSVFITLSTFLVVRYLKFPKVNLIDKFKSKKYRYGIYGFLMITVLPSVIIFWTVIQETRFQINSEKFITENCYFEGSELISKKIIYNDTLSIIDLFYIGNRIDAEKINELQTLLSKYISKQELFSVTDKTKLIIHQERDESAMIQQKFETMNKELRMSVLEDIYTKNQSALMDKDKKIQLLENELMKSKTMGLVPMDQLQRELQFHFKDIEKFSFANVVEVRGTEKIIIDTIPSILIHFEEKIKSKEKEAKIKEIGDWLKVRLEKDKMQVIEY